MYSLGKVFKELNVALMKTYTKPSNRNSFCQTRVDLFMLAVF